MCICTIGLSMCFTHKHTHLKLRVSVWGAADPMHAVVSLRSLGECWISLVDVPAMSQLHITHKQQSRAVRHTGLWVFQTGAVDEKHEVAY